MALVSELVTKVTADTKSFVSGMATVTAAASAAGAAIFYTVDKITDKVDGLAKSAQKLGVGFESFQALKYAAEIANVPLDRLQAGMVKLTRNVYDAANGNKEALETFNKLGLSASQLSKMDLDDQYAAVAHQIGNLSNKNEQLALSMKVFGKAGSDNLLLIRENGNALMKEFKSLGLSITDNQAAVADSFQDTKTKLTTIFSGFATQVGLEVAPAFTILMDELTKSLTGMGDLRAAARSLAATLVSVAEFGVKGFDIFLSVLDSVRDRVDQIITGIGNAVQRVKMVHQFLVNGVSGAGWSVDPSMIGRLNPTGNAPASSLGGSASGLLSRLGDLKESLEKPIMDSFIEPVRLAGNAASQFATATQKASSQIASLIKGNVDSKTSERIQQLLEGSQGFNDQREVYRDSSFESKYQAVFDAITKSRISQDEFQRAIADLAERAKVDSNGNFNAAPNIAAVQDLQKYGAENGLVGTPKQKAELKVFVKADKGFITEFADQPQFGDAVGKWLEIITEASN